MHDTQGRDISCWDTTPHNSQQSAQLRAWMRFNLIAEETKKKQSKAKIKREINGLASRGRPAARFSRPVFLASADLLLNPDL